MSSTPSVSPGVSDLLQFFSASGATALSTALSSSAVQSALQTAPAADVLTLSEQVLQLQQVQGLLGTSGSTDALPASSDPGTLLLEQLASSGATTSGASTAAAASSIAATQGFAQQEASALFGANSSVSLLG